MPFVSFRSCRMAALALVLVATACGGGGDGQDRPPPPPDDGGGNSTQGLTVGPELGDAVASRITNVATADGAIPVSVRTGSTAGMAGAAPGPLVLATGTQGEVILAALGAERTLSERSTAAAIVWLLQKPVLADTLDDAAFSTAVATTAGFDALVGEVRHALAAGSSPFASESVLRAASQVSSVMVRAQLQGAGRARPSAAIARPRLASRATVLAVDDPGISGNIFVRSTGNLDVFNGTAIYWSAQAITYDGQKVSDAVRLDPVSVLDSQTYTKGTKEPPSYDHVPGHPTRSYDLVVQQDALSLRANAVMMLRLSIEALLGPAKLGAFGRPGECLSQWLETVTGKELDDLVASGSAASIDAYLDAFKARFAQLVLASSAADPCGTPSAGLLKLLADGRLYILASLELYSTAAKMVEAGKVGEAIGTWVAVMTDFTLANDGKLRKLGVCVAGGEVVHCAVRYGLDNTWPWLEGARARLPLVAYDARDERTAVPASLQIESQQLLPLTASPDSIVTVLSEGVMGLTLRDEATDFDNRNEAKPTLTVDPGRIRFVPLLGSQVDGPFFVGATRALSVLPVAESPDFYGDVDFTWSVAPGFEGVVSLGAVGQRTATVKALKAGPALIYAFNAVTNRRLDFLLGVEERDMIGMNLSFNRRYPDTATPFWTRPSVSTIVRAGPSDAIDWISRTSGGIDATYMTLDPEARDIRWTLGLPSSYGGSDTTFDGFVVEGFTSDIASVTVVSASGIGVSVSHSARAVFVNLSGNYNTGAGFTLRLSFH